MKTLVWIGILVGSIIGSYVPTLWGAGYFSVASVLFSGAGAFAGIWAGYLAAQYLDL
jgi:hypothetical protein